MFWVAEKSHREEDRMAREHKEEVQELHKDLHEKDEKIEQLIDNYEEQLSVRHAHVCCWPFHKKLKRARRILSSRQAFPTNLNTFTVDNHANGSAAGRIVTMRDSEEYCRAPFAPVIEAFDFAGEGGHAQSSGISDGGSAGGETG